MKMLNLGKFLGMIVLIFQVIWADGVKATVSNSEVVKGNPVQFQIEATGDDPKFPNIQNIDGNPIAGSQTGTSSSYIYANSRLESRHTTMLTLTFFPQKDLTIPSYEVEIGGQKYQTDPIEIKLVTSNASVVPNGELFTLEIKADKPKVMVGESLIVTLSFALRSDAKISQGVEFRPPTFPGFMVTDMQDKRSYRKGNYQIEELHYMLSAQSEGNFTANPAYVKVGLLDRSRRDVFGMFFGTVWKEGVSNALNFEVVSQEKKSDLVGDFKLDAMLDSKEVKANQPVNLTIKIEGDGNLQGFEFPQYEIDGVTVYSDEAKIESKVIDGKLHSTYSKSFAFIAEEEFTIPERYFSVWNPENKTMQTLEVPEYHVKITNKSLSPAANTEAPKGIVQTETALSIAPKETIVENKVEERSVAWWMLAVSFVLGVVSVFVLKWLWHLKPTRKSFYSEAEALKILYPHISESSEVDEMVRQLYARKNGDTSIKIDKKVLKEMVDRFSLR
ncbi:MAG: hypothetical protein RL113_1362 [Pseudomonadota bacterium]